MKVFLFKRFRGLRLQLKQLYLFQIFPCDIVHYTEFLRSFPISHVKFFSSGVIAIQMLTSSFEDIEKGNINDLKILFDFEGPEKGTQRRTLKTE